MEAWLIYKLRINGGGGAFLTTNDSEFVIVVITVSPKPEFSQQFCPRLYLVYFVKFLSIWGWEDLDMLTFSKTHIVIADTQ